jgi:hypothetical protein
MPQLREEVVGRVERAQAPSWSTFAGAAGGVWAGSVLAASPFSGAVEALALDADGKPTVTGAWTRRVVRHLAHMHAHAGACGVRSAR